VVCLISQIRRMGQYKPLRTYHLPSAPVLTVAIPNLPVNVAEKALESLSSPAPLRGEMKDVSTRPTFVHALNVLVPFTSLPSLYKKDWGSVKVSWTKRRFISRDFFQSSSGVKEASVDESTPAPKMDPTVRPLKKFCFFFTAALYLFFC
jgi:hypothetical protein